LGSAPSAEAMLRLLDATDLEVRGSTVHSRTTVSQAIGRSIAASVVPARAAARRALSVNKLRQIGIALHNYHDVHKHFPPAVIMGPDGKTPHSWRVALLPYLDKPGLYEQYRLDEPWDSEHNRSLVAAGAELFSVPSETPSDDCGYFALVGPGTAFDPDKTPLGVRNIVDGTSKTVAIVEAKRSIPWTTPEDVVYDPDGPLPKLGGFFTGGFDALFLDAHVSFLPDDVDERLLRALISYSGRESTTVDPKTGLDTLGKPR
jgi:hypothetical protein